MTAHAPQAAAPPASGRPGPGPALGATPLLSQWIELLPDRRVLLRVGKVEIGQGIVTALLQIAAEELDVDWWQVVAVPASTAGSPDEGVTAGSRSVMDSGRAVRAVCAEVRLLLLSAASAESGVPVDELEVRGGQISDRAGVAHTDYWSLVRPGLLDVPVSGTARPKDPGRHGVVGHSVPRRDLPRKFAGGPAFVHDLAFPGQLFGRVVRPPSPGARLLEADEGAARELPAVVAVVRLGSFLGVVAEREEEAVRAAELLRRDARWQAPATLPDQSAWTPVSDGQVSEEVQVERREDPAAGARVVDRFRASYSRGYLAHASIGPGGAVARWDGGAVSVWSQTQGVFPLQRAVAASLDLDPKQVTVHHAEGAGCYGHNSADDVAFDAVLLARAVPGRHVQVVWSRDDEFAWEPYGSAMVVELAVGLDGSGDVVTWRHDAWSYGHHGRPGYGGQPGLLGAWHAADASPVPASDPPAAVGAGIGRNAVPQYAVADLDVRTHRLLAMPLRTSSLRGLGATANVFAIESAMDELAVRAGVDPLAYRLRQLPDERARHVLRLAADRAGWATRAEEDSVGWGLGYARYKGVCGFCAVVARVEAVSDVRVSDLWVAVDAGQIVNPDGLANQVEGGAIQATSWALREQVTYDRRSVTSRDWDSYPILRFGEVPEVHVALVSCPEEPPLGVGEVAGGPVVAAIGNALADALGVRLRDLPLTKERILAVITTD